MTIGIIECDSAAVMPSATSKGFEISYNDEYKYLSAFPLFEDGSYGAVASKDKKEWVICVGACIDGEPVDVRDIAKQLHELSKGDKE